MGRTRDNAVQAIQRAAQPLEDLNDLDRLLDLIGESRIVLLGEATHGTQEFYRLRAEITRRLIIEKRFDAIAVEGDWPAALRVSRWVRGRSTEASARQALGGFERFPRWMWRNTEVVALLEWLRAYNAVQDNPAEQVGFFGLDLYSLRDSMQAVLHYLDEVDPEAAQRARARYGCFDDFAYHPQAYGHAVSFGLREDCEREVVTQLTELMRQAGRDLARHGTPRGEELFYAQQNARVVRSAESYYRSMFAGRAESWNVRDRHMAATLGALRSHLTAQRERPARIVVWAHNSHIGDARATDRSERGQLNLGQLVREQQHDADETFLLGFTTHTGTVAAASDWDAPVELKAVRPSRIDSIERLMHESEAGRFVLPLNRSAPDALRRALQQPRLERAIGVIYRPETERWSHYFHAALADQFDAVVHLDQTRALQPLEHEHPWEHTEEPETYPSGL
ncbi:erythromycin esterase family protein [Azohydromonas australica]|uniref:erythromycin esterase family protein n=1 Tax=Azohydromonas australica TaxID=364039 RepID=UPI00041B66C3|nr:erythromycin esterase family protein [Azohydromonas australica]